MQQNWELQYEKTWDEIQEKDGSLRDTVQNIMLKQKRQFQHPDKSFKRGIMRHVYIVIDTSTSTSEADLAPNRLVVLLEKTKEFAFEFFDQNPLAQLGVLLCRDGICQVLSELVGNPLTISDALKSKKMMDPSGEMSLQNALLLANGLFKTVQTHGSKEILLLVSSLSSTDPGDILDTLSDLKNQTIRVSSIHLSSELNILRVFAKETMGSSHVVLDSEHLHSLLLNHVLPPALFSNSEDELLRMGFPIRCHDISFCACHEDLTVGGFICPQCSNKVCHVPSTCIVCDLSLVSSSHLARSFHFIFPLKRFLETDSITSCFGCQRIDKSCTCPLCHHHFCIDCDIFLHEVLHNCPGCLLNNLL